MKNSVCIALLFILCPHLQQSARAQSGPRYNGPSSCQSASSLGFTSLDSVTDQSTQFLALLTANITNSAICIAIDCNSYFTLAQQIITPTTGAPNYNHPSIRFTGCGGTVFSSAGASFLNLTYGGGANGGYQFINVGGGASGSFGGSLTIDNVVVTNTTSSCNSMVKSTLSVYALHAAFLPTCPGQTVDGMLTVGGTNSIATTRTNSVNDWFSGRWLVDDVSFAPGKALKTQSSANAGEFVHSQAGPSSTADGRVVELNGASGGGSNDTRGILISGNLFELFTPGSCGIYQSNSSAVYVIGNHFFDIAGGSQAICPTASTKNGYYLGNFYNDLSGGTSGVTAMDASNTVMSIFDNLMQFPGKVNHSGFIQGTSAAPAVDATSCTGATIGTGATNLAGTITGLPGSACTIVMTFASATAAHGWSCSVSNQTHTGSTNMFQQSASNTTTVTFKGTSVASDVLAYGPCVAF